MTAIVRPSSTTDWGGTQVAPSGGEKAAGFAAGDRPPAQWLNYLLGNTDEWIKYLDEQQGAQRRAVDALLDWRNIDPGVSKHFNGVASNGTDTIVIVGQTATILVSTDGGITFSASTAGSGYVGNFNAVAWDATHSLWIAVGASSEIQTSPDAVTWTRRTTGVSTYWAVAVSPLGRVVVVGDVCKVSSDALAYGTGGTLTAVGTHIVYDAAAGLFIMGTSSGTASDCVAYSSTGSAWTKVTTAIALMRSIAVDPILGVILVGPDGGFSSDYKVVRTANGLVYTTVDTFTDASASFVVAATGVGFVIESLNSMSIVRRSIDGVTWVANLQNTQRCSNFNGAFKVLELGGSRVAFALCTNSTFKGYWRSRSWSVPV